MSIWVTKCTQVKRALCKPTKTLLFEFSKAIYLEENQFCEIPMKIIDDDDSELEGNKD